MSEMPVDNSKRRFLVAMSSAVGGVAAVELKALGRSSSRMRRTFRTLFTFSSRPYEKCHRASPASAPGFQVTDGPLPNGKMEPATVAKAITTLDRLR